jgi:uncharacterized protein
MNKLYNPDIVIYHSGCSDGTTAAWVFHEYAKTTSGCKIPDFWGAKHGDPPIPMDKILNKTVVMVDFSYKRDVIEKMLTIAKKLVILDHHKSAQKDLEGLPCAIFDMTRAGCQLAWDYVYPPDRNPPKPRPNFLNLIADRDLWTWKLPSSQAINKVFYLKGLTNSISEIDKIKDMNLSKLAEEGRFYLNYENELMEKLSRFKTSYYFGNQPENPTKFYKVFVMAAYYMQSELGHKISEENPDHDFVILYCFEHQKCIWNFSCRARADTDIDIGAILKPYGGGGHPKAAGFEIKSATWPRNLFLKENDMKCNSLEENFEEIVINSS